MAKKFQKKSFDKPKKFQKKSFPTQKPDITLKVKKPTQHKINSAVYTPEMAAKNHAANSKVATEKRAIEQAKKHVATISHEHPNAQGPAAYIDGELHKAKVMVERGDMTQEQFSKYKQDLFKKFLDSPEGELKTKQRDAIKDELLAGEKFEKNMKGFAGGTASLFSVGMFGNVLVIIIIVLLIWVVLQVFPLAIF